MFFQGSLQEGISQAVQQARLVICFVTEGGAESIEWEENILMHDDVKSLLESQSVLLRLEAGSENEAFLAQLYPLPKKPTLVCIKGGELKEYIAGGTPTELILQRLQKALQPAQEAAQPVAHSPPQATSSSSQSLAPPPVPSTVSPVASEDTSPGQATPSSTSSNNNSNPQQVQSLLVERAARLEAQRKREAEEAKRRREEKGKAKAEELAANPSKKAETKDKHADQYKKRKQAERDERARILKAIEDDKTARKARQADREAERRAALELEQGGYGETPLAPASQLLPSTGRLSEHCSLQVRLFDGSTLRSRFSSRETVRKDVRQFVDENRTDGDAPYTFKVLLTPLPNKTIDVTEENKSLQELQLTPSATLILLPVQKYAGAYAGEGSIFQRLLAFILAFFAPIATFFTTMFSVSGPPQAPDATEAHTSQSEEREKRLRGLRDRGERPNDQQFYNGNSVSQPTLSWLIYACKRDISD